MPDLIQIERLSIAGVREAISPAVAQVLDADSIAGWLAAVDWGQHEAADLAVRTLLGELEQWSTAFAEGDLSSAEYKRRLLSVLSGRAGEYSKLPSAS